LSVRKQCELLSVSRGQLYYTPKEERPENLQIMRIMDEHLLAHPTEGIRSMVHLLKDHLYLNPAETGTELYQQVEYFVNYYNNRHHQGIKDKPNNLYTSNSLPLNKAS
jgi:hypothetical protein